MGRRLLRPAVLAAALLFVGTAVPATAAPAPQVTDPAKDGHGVAMPLEAGNQEYADGLSVLWQSTRRTAVVRGRRVSTVTGFTVTMTLTGAPTPPEHTVVVYRALGSRVVGTSECQFGLVYYSAKMTDPDIPQSAIRDACVSGTRLTAIDAPVIKGNTITWNVPLTKIPRDLKVGLGTVVTELRFEIVMLVNYPACAPVREVGCGRTVHTIDSTPLATRTFRIGE